MVDNNFKRQTSLIFLWSPFFILGLELVDKEIKRPPSLFSCGVLISHLVKKWSTTISRGIPLFFLVESLLHTWFRNGRQQFQEANLFDFLVKSLLHTWFRTGRQRNQEAFLLDYLVKSFLHTWFRTGRERNQEAFLFYFLVKSFLHTWFRTGRQRHQEAFHFD
jgi:hypothetical protein